MKRTTFNLVIVLAALSFSSLAIGQGMHGPDESHRKDMVAIHALLADSKKVKRTVKELTNGVETVTESSDKEVAKLIQSHVAAMQKRVKEGRPIRMWDPLFAELFANHAKITMTITATKTGMKVIETSKDPYTIQLIKMHAQAVNGFVKDGIAGMHKEHPAPKKPGEKPAEFLGKGDGVTTCPVTGEPIDKKVSAEIMGRTVYFCCAGCVDTVKKNPKAYLKP